MLRAALAITATLLMAWFVVLARGDAIGRSAESRVHDHPHMSTADWNRTMDDLRKADFLGVGSEWDVRRAAYLLLRDRPEAARLARSVTRREPDNLDAWAVLLHATDGLDPRQASYARAQIRRLSPQPSR
jgi:hypothetical protein